MVVQTHHYHRTPYAIGAMLGLAALGVLAWVVLTRGSDEAPSRIVIAVGLLTMVAGGLLWLRYTNECIYFTPNHVVHIDCTGRRRTQIPIQEIRGLQPLLGPRGHSAAYALLGSGRTIVFDASITEFEELRSELEWKLKSASANHFEGWATAPATACPPSDEPWH